MRQDIKRAKREINTLPDTYHAELACVCLLALSACQPMDGQQDAAAKLMASSALQYLSPDAATRSYRGVALQA